jgi:hypothetical protein
LFHVAFDLCFGEIDLWIFKQTGQIVVHIWRDHEHAGFFACVLWSLNGHLFQFQNVDMVQLFQQFDLSQSRDGKAVLLIMHQNLFQSDKLPCLFRSCL